MDPIQQEAIEIGAAILKDIVESAYSSATSWWGKKSKERDFLGRSTRRYAEKMIERYNYVKVMGMHEPVPLKSLFVQVNILEKISSRLGLSPEALASFYERDKRRLKNKQKSIDGTAAINKLQRFIVLGKPGAGKTTYLKYLTLAMLDKNSAIKDKRFPIFITLKEWADSKQPLMDFMVKELDICGVEEGDDFVARLLKKGKCLILFDGLDEVSQEANQDDIIQQIIEFSEKYSDNKFVISCRVAAYNHWFQKFTDVEIADFNDQQIENFIQNWFRKEPQVAKACWGELKQQQSLKELAQTPLLLTLLCINYDDNDRFPENRADLYEEAIDALLKKWDASRRIKRDEIYKDLSLLKKRSLFEKIAYVTFEEGPYFINQRKLEGYIQGVIEHFSDFEAKMRLNLDPAAILQSIEAQHGILVQGAKRSYSFSHPTFQEYFVASYLVKEEPDFAAVLIPHLDDARWKEVFLFTAGLLDDKADDLLYAIQREQHKRIRANDVLTILLKSLEESLITTPSNSYTLTERKVGALYLLSALSFHSNLSYELARRFGIDLEGEYANDSRALVFNLPFDRNFDFSEINRTAKTIKKLCRENKNDQSTMASFLKANILLMDCLKAASSLHKETRQDILDRLLSLPSGV